MQGQHRFPKQVAILVHKVNKCQYYYIKKCSNTDTRTSSSTAKLLNFKESVQFHLVSVLLHLTSLLTDEHHRQGQINNRGLFQSTPVIADGRTAKHVAKRKRSRGFNPRPSLLTDEHHNDVDYQRELRFNPRPSLLTDEQTQRAGRNNP